MNQQHKMKQQKMKINLGSPRVVKPNLLNANTFFTLDYQTIQQTQFPKSNRILQSYHISPNQTIIYNQSKKRNSFNVKNVKSAQYYRNGQSYSNHKYRASLNIYNPYSRIKRVDEQILQIKRNSVQKTQTVILGKKQQQFNVKSMKKTQFSPRLTLKSFPINNQNQRVKALSFALQPQTQQNIFDIFLKEGIISEKQKQKSPQSNKQFTQNYKNRRKLTDRIANKRKSPADNTTRSISPIRWKNNTKIDDTKTWDPQSGQLLIHHSPKLLESIEGNKIQYTNKQTKKNNLAFKRYQLQKITKGLETEQQGENLSKKTTPRNNKKQNNQQQTQNNHNISQK